MLVSAMLFVTLCNVFHCTSKKGTALGVIRTAHEQGKCVHVLVDETRPRLQGARLTAWELKQYGIPYEIICDNMAGYFLRKGDVQKVLHGADRIAANGDTANKIGTYGLAVLARYHDIPLVVAAPATTIDSSIASGAEIPIEERSPAEVAEPFGIRIIPAGVPVCSPSFDVTPAHLIAAIVTDEGIHRPPYHFAGPVR